MHRWNYLLHPHPTIDETCIQGPLRYLWCCNSRWCVAFCVITLELILYSILVAIILFIFSVTSASIKGWATSYVLAPLIISVLLLGTFFLWEYHLDEADAAMYVPPYLPLVSS
jgi:hypothetical protein